MLVTWHLHLYVQQLLLLWSCGSLMRSPADSQVHSDWGSWVVGPSSGMTVLIGVSQCQARRYGITNCMAQTQRSWVFMLLHPVTPSHNGKTMCYNTERREKRKRRGGRVVDPDIGPVTFLAAGVLWLLMMPNNLGLGDGMNWRKKRWIECQICTK